MACLYRYFCITFKDNYVLAVQFYPLLEKYMDHNHKIYYDFFFFFNQHHTHRIVVSYDCFLCLLISKKRKRKNKLKRDGKQILYVVYMVFIWTQPTPASALPWEAVTEMS